MLLFWLIILIICIALWGTYWWVCVLLIVFGLWLHSGGLQGLFEESEYPEPLHEEVVIHDIDKDYVYTKSYCQKKGLLEIEEELYFKHGFSEDVWNAIVIINSYHWYYMEYVTAHKKDDGWYVIIGDHDLPLPVEIQTERDVKEWFRNAKFQNHELRFQA